MKKHKCKFLNMGSQNYIFMAYFLTLAFYSIKHLREIRRERTLVFEHQCAKAYWPTFSQKHVLLYEGGSIALEIQ